MIKQEGNLDKFNVILLALIAIGGLFLFPNNVLAANSDIVISEIAAYESSGCEWIEVYNKGSAPVDMIGWKFWEGGINHGLKVSSSSVQIDTTIEPGEYAIIAQDDKKLFFDTCGGRYLPPNGTVFDSSWSTLNESGELIGLKDSSGNFIEQFTYISAKNFSLERADLTAVDYTAVNWHEHASGNTFGLPNATISNAQTPEPQSIVEPVPTTPIVEAPPVIPDPILVAPLPAQTDVNARVVVNEFVYDPAMGDHEWVEIYNDSDRSVDISNWILRDGVGKIASLTGTISAHGFAVVELSGSRLNNNGDFIGLYDSVEKLRDQVSYGLVLGSGQNSNQALTASTGSSIARLRDGFDTNNDNNDFVETTIPTKGSANKIVQKSIPAIVSIIPTLTSSSNPQPSVVLGNLPSISVSTTTESAKSSSNTLNLDTAAVGSVLTISGVVMSLPGMFGTQYFYLGFYNNENNTIENAWQIYQNKKIFPDLAIGDMISVTGEVSEIASGRRLKIEGAGDIEKLNDTVSPEPVPVTSDQISQLRDGTFVSVTGEVTEKKSGHLFVDDKVGEVGIVVKSGTGISTKEIGIGDKVVIVGLALKNSKKQIEVYPRVENDIEIISHYKKAQKNSSSSNTQTPNDDGVNSSNTQAIFINDTSNTSTEKYLTAGGVGLSSLLLGLIIRTRGAFLLAVIRRKKEGEE